MFKHKLFSCVFGNGGQGMGFDLFGYVFDGYNKILCLLGTDWENPDYVHSRHRERNWA